MAEVLKTFDVDDTTGICCFGNGIWVSKRNFLALHNEDFETQRTLDCEFTIRDFVVISSDEMIVTDDTNKRVVWISDSGKIRTVCNTEPLVPYGICFNDSQQMVVGLRKWKKVPPLKLVIYSPDGSSVTKEIEKDEGGEPIFREALYRVKQNGNGDYVVCDDNRVVSVSGEGGLRWRYEVEKNKFWDPEMLEITGIVCDQQQNIVFAECFNDKISVLDKDGLLIRTFAIRDDGVEQNIYGEHPNSLSLDHNGFLWVGQHRNIKKVKYSD